jgi:hypothetical protein
MQEHPRPQPTLFTYGTGMSLRAPERRSSRAPLVVAVLLLTAAIAALVVVGVLWLATADYGALLSAAVEYVSALARRG